MAALGHLSRGRGSRNFSRAEKTVRTTGSEEMDFTSALILSLIVVIVVYIALRALKVRGFSSLAVALLIGLLVMLAVANPRDMANLNVQNIQSYSFIVGIVVIILIIYILVHGLGDREPKAAPFSILPTWGNAAPVVVAQPQAVVV